MTKTRTRSVAARVATVKKATEITSTVKDHDEDSPADLAYQAAHQAMLTKNRYPVLEERAVRLGRQGGLSWDTIGGWLSVPGETLRRRYGAS